MKKDLTLACIFFLCFVFKVRAQNCSVSISGTECTNSQLTALASGDDLAHLTWLQYGSLNVFEADTITSQKMISLPVMAIGNWGPRGLAFPCGGMALDKDGNIYIVDKGNMRVQKFTPGLPDAVTVAGGNGYGNAANQLGYPTDVFVDDNYNVYVADADNSRIQKWAPGATEGVTVAGGNGYGFAANQLYYAEGVYVDKKGNVFVADTYNYRVQLWKPGATKGITVAGGNASGMGADQFALPKDIYLDAAHNIYVADVPNAGNHRVQKWVPGAAEGVTVAGGNGTGAAANQFGFLLSIYVDAAGNIYAADNGVDGQPVSRIQKWAPGAANGVTVAGHAAAWDEITYPTGVTVDKKGFIYVLESTHGMRVRKYKPTNGVVDSTYTPSQPAPYTVKAEFKNGCVATSDVVIIRAKPTKPEIFPARQKGNSNLCAGSTETYYVNLWDDVTIYQWQAPNGTTLLSSVNDSATLSIPQGFNQGNLLVRATNNCGISAAGSLLLTGRPVKPGNIRGPRQVGQSQEGIVFSVNDNTSYHNWIVPADAVIQSGQGSPAITVKWGATPGQVQVNAYNDCGSSVYNSIDINVVNSLIAGNKQEARSNSLDAVNGAFVYPNPAKNTITVQLSAAKQENYTITLQSLKGELLVQKSLQANAGTNSVKIDASRYAKGTYIISIQNSTDKIILKAVKE